MSDDTTPAPTTAVDQTVTPSAAVESTVLLGVPLPAELTQSDPAILVDAVRGSGEPPDVQRRKR